MKDIELGDKRLNRAAQDLHDAMIEQQSCCVRSLGKDRAGEVRYGRFLSNKKTEVHHLIDQISSPIKARCDGRHVLLIQDTSELNYQNHAKRVRGLGTVGNGHDKGFFIHPVLGIDAEDGACLGLAHIHLWQRTGVKIKGAAKSQAYRTKPIEDKESHRWIRAPQQAIARLSPSTSVTVIGDRESDIFELWDRLPDERTHLLVRACRDRLMVASSPLKLNDWLDALPSQGAYLLDLPARAGKRSARTAKMHLRFSAVSLCQPMHCTDKNASPSVDVWAIDVREDPSTVPAGEEPVHWRLLTTHPITTIEEARQCVRWYQQRWHIEQTFRTLKTQGLKIESSLLETAESLEKLAVMALSAAVSTIQLTLARDGKTTRPASDVVPIGAYPLLGSLNARHEGATQKQKNPHVLHSLAWLAWIIARLGGWKGYASERPPGPITLLRGLQAFANIRQGWEMAHDG